MLWGLGGEVNVNPSARPLVVLHRLRGNVSGQRGEIRLWM